MIYPIRMNERYFLMELARLRRQSRALNNPLHAVHAQLGKLLIQAEEYLDDCQLWSVLSHPAVGLTDALEVSRLRVRYIYHMARMSKESEA